MSCDNFAYDFPYDCSGIVGGYGVRRMCLQCIQISRDVSVRTLRGDCIEIEQFQCSLRNISKGSFL